MKTIINIDRKLERRNTNEYEAEGNMNNDQQCTRTFLAGVGHCMVEKCSCGTIHMRLGDISLRLTPDSLETMTTVLVDASLKIREQEQAKSKMHRLQVMPGGLSQEPNGGGSHQTH